MLKSAPGEYYHLYNRGMQKQPIFVNDSDRIRFLFYTLVFQGSKHIKNISRHIKQSVQSSTLHINTDLLKEIEANRRVELVHFCLMPNHFHLLVKEREEGGIAKYMQRVLTAYTKYFNKRHNKSGHLFQGKYKSVHIINDEQLMYLSTYIHKNPSELKVWKGKEEQYQWSSYTDCLNNNRFEGLLNLDIVMSRYPDNSKKEKYKKFVETSVVKELK